MNTNNEGVIAPTMAETQGRPCLQCQELGEETWLEAGTYYCEECQAAYCPYCGTEAMKACTHNLAASYSEADDLTLMGAGFESFPSLDPDVDDQADTKNRSEIAARSFGPLLPIYKAYGYDQDEEPLHGGREAGTILEACLEYLGIPFHVVNYETGTMGISFGEHYFTENADAVSEKVSMLQGRLAKSFDSMTQLLQ